MDLLSLASNQLRKAADLVDKIDELKAELSATLGSTDIVNEARKIKRRMSEAGRLAIATAQRARWVKTKANAPVKPTKAKRAMSPAARAKIAAAAKRRWAKAKAAGKKTL